MPVVLDQNNDTNTMKVVVKFKIYKHKETGKIIRIPEYMGTVKKNYTFEALQDFEYFPKLPEKYLIPNLKNYLSTESLNKADIFKEIPNALNSSILPAAFSKSHNMYIQKANYLYEDMDDLNTIHDKKDDRSRFIAKFTHFMDKDIPQPPKEPESLKEREEFQFLKKCFAERPVWLKNSLMRESTGKIKFESFHIFKKSLSFTAYSFKDGPWKHTYVRFGYDPRGETTALQYQVIDVGNMEKQGKYDGLNLSYKRNEFDTYDPTYTEAPTKLRQTYQLCDIKDAEVKQIWEKEMMALEKKEDLKPCDRKFGWLSQKGFKAVLKHMKNKFKSN